MSQAWRWEYGPADQSITITLDSLASTASRESDYIDNTVDGFIDALVTASIKSGSAAAANVADYCTDVFAWGAYALSTLPSGIAGVDGAHTGSEGGQLQFVGRVSGERSGNDAVLNKTTTAVFSIAHALGGLLPPYWGLVIRNCTNTVLATSGHSVMYQGIKRALIDA